MKTILLVAAVEALFFGAAFLLWYFREAVFGGGIALGLWATGKAPDGIHAAHRGEDLDFPHTPDYVGKRRKPEPTIEEVAAEWAEDQAKKSPGVSVTVSTTRKELVSA